MHKFDNIKLFRKFNSKSMKMYDTIAQSSKFGSKFLEYVEGIQVTSSPNSFRMRIREAENLYSKRGFVIVNSWKK